MQDYFRTQLDKNQSKIQRLKRKSAQFAALRFLLFAGQIGAVVLSINYENGSFLLGLIPFVVVFFRILRLHVDVKNEIAFHLLMQEQLQLELDYELHQKPTWDLKQYAIEPNHPFAHDIDVTGKFGLLHHIDRTQFTNGRLQLIDFLCKTVSAEAIMERQELIQSLLPKSEWRDELRAHMARATDPIEITQTLEKWKHSTISIPNGLLMISVILSATLGLGIVGQLFGVQLLSTGILVLLFFVHNGLLASQLKQINSYIQEGDKINDSFLAFERVLHNIEQEHLEHTFFKSIKQTLGESLQENQFKKFQANYQRLTTIQHVLATLILNGLSGYHLWIFRKFSREKVQFSERLIGVLGKLETLDAILSLVQFTQHHPHYSYPKIANNGHTSFEELKHPLIHKNKAIGNSFELNHGQIMILTGSNMSGKSTFLRTVGLNITLMNAGCPIAAEQAMIALKPMWASMRLSDSTVDDTSYFYAEVKRIQTIIETAQTTPLLVLLDELLRGTNSEDKLEGTLRVIEHLIKSNTTGFVATHDLEVCKLIDKYPASIVNKCFEAQINGTELSFDYRLREGICQVKSATFLLEKAGITPLTKSLN